MKSATPAAPGRGVFVIQVAAQRVSFPLPSVGTGTEPFASSGFWSTATSTPNLSIIIFLGTIDPLVVEQVGVIVAGTGVAVGVGVGVGVSCFIDGVDVAGVGLLETVVSGGGACETSRTTPSPKSSKQQDHHRGDPN